MTIDSSSHFASSLPVKCYGDSACLVARREQLLQRIAQQRQYFHAQTQVSLVNGDAFKRVQGLIGQARQHPRLLLLCAAVIFVVKPRRIMTSVKIAARAWIIWKTWIR